MCHLRPHQHQRQLFAVVNLHVPRSRDVLQQMKASTKLQTGRGGGGRRSVCIIGKTAHLPCVTNADCDEGLSAPPLHGEWDVVGDVPEGAEGSEERFHRARRLLLEVQCIQCSIKIGPPGSMRKQVSRRSQSAALNRISSKLSLIHHVSRAHEAIAVACDRASDCVSNVLPRQVAGRILKCSPLQRAPRRASMPSGRGVTLCEVSSRLGEPPSLH